MLPRSSPRSGFASEIASEVASGVRATTWAPGADGAIIKVLAGTSIRTTIGAADGEIPALASDPNSATAWVNSNMVPHYPASKSTLITVGSEVRVAVGQGWPSTKHMLHECD
jgi:hypothetical protein